MFAALWWLAGCTCQPDPQVQQAYQQARAEALADPPLAGIDWEPDALLQVSPPLFQRLVTAALRAHGPLERELHAPAGIVLSPEVAVHEARLSASTGCDPCVQADLDLIGELGFRAGLLGTGRVPIAMRAVAVVRLQVQETDAGWEIWAHPRHVERVTVEPAKIPRGLLRLSGERLRSWAEKELTEMPPRVVGRLSERYPVAELRLVPAGDGLEVEIRTTATDPSPLLGTPPRPSQGWQVDVTTASAVALARTHLFRRGPRTRLELVGVPASVGISGHRLTMDLRVWRVAPPGWWRDVRADATLAIEAGEIAITPGEVEITGASERAVLNDPLSAAGQPVMLREIKNVLRRRESASRSTLVHGHRLTATATEIGGTEGGSLLRLRGDATLEPTPE